MADESVEEKKDGEVNAGTEVAVEDNVQPASSGEVEGVEEKEPHPLEPGGKRFNEVWARAKKAESESQREREARLVAEAKLDAYKELGVTKTDKGEKVYSWEELETFIDNGQMTRAEASTYREREVIKKATAEAESRAEARVRTETRLATTSKELKSYIDEVPEIAETGSETRQKLEAEFAWLASMYGTPEKGSVAERAMELNAVRNVLGPLDKVSTRKDSDRLTRSSRETMAESNSTANRGTASGSGKDPVAGLTSAQKAHYERMFKSSNAYPNGWDSVREELKWIKPRGR
jgi:hypothetical protein